MENLPRCAQLATALHASPVNIYNSLTYRALHNYLTSLDPSPPTPLPEAEGSVERNRTVVRFCNYQLMRILIVEDDPTLADGLTRSLQRADYAVDCVHDGEHADHVLAAQSYDLVILDLGLPKLDGFEVIRRVRRRGATVPVLVLTAHLLIAAS